VSRPSEHRSSRSSHGTEEEEEARERDDNTDEDDNESEAGEDGEDGEDGENGYSGCVSMKAGKEQVPVRDGDGGDKSKHAQLDRIEEESDDEKEEDG
jgi:hypothetical protein